MARVAAKHKQQQQQHKKRPKLHSREPALSEWEQLASDLALREGWLEFARAVNLAQTAAEEQAARLRVPVSESLDLRGATRVLEQYPQLVRYLDGVRERQDLRQDALSRLDATKASPTGAARGESGQVGNWASSSRVGNLHNQPIGVNNARLLRAFADGDEWLNAGINFLCDRVARADIAVLPQDERKRYNRAVLKDMELLLDQPNEYKDTWPMLIGSGSRDLLTLGQAALTKSMTPDRKPTALYAEDAANIKVYPAWSGNPDEPRYLYAEGSFAMAARSVPLRNDEVIVPFYHPATYRFGYGPVQVLVDTIRADLKATEAALRMVEMKPPPHLVHLTGWQREKIRQLRADYESEIAGRRELLFLGGDEPIQVFPLMFDAKSNQWLDYQEYLVRKMCAVLQCSPQDLGITFQINRATGEVQQEISNTKGYLPLLLLWEEYLNRECLDDYAPKLANGRTDRQALNLRVLFPEVSEAERRMHYARDIEIATNALAGLPAATLNQLLMMRGEEPVPHGGNTFYVLTKDGPMPWLSYDNDYEEFQNPLGMQDAGGGIDETAEDDIGSDSTSDDDVASSDSEQDAVQQVTSEDAAQMQATGGGTGVSGGTPSSTTASYRPSGHFIDRRMPGRHWNPTLVRRATPRRVPDDVARAHHRPHAEVQARAELLAAVKRTFEDAERRGSEQIG